MKFYLNNWQKTLLSVLLSASKGIEFLIDILNFVVILIAILWVQERLGITITIILFIFIPAIRACLCYDKIRAAVENGVEFYVDELDDDDGDDFDA